MTSELVSVITRIKDINPDYLRKCIKSIFSQTFQNFELIVVFDLARTTNDNLALAVLEEYADDGRLKIIHSSKPRGRAGSMNQGLMNSTGDVIAIMDGDDYSLPTRFSEQIDYMNATNVSLIGSWACTIDENDKLLGFFTPPTEHKDIRKYLLLHDPFWHSTIMFRREIMKETGMYNTAFDGAEDYEFYLRVISRGYRTSNIPKFLAYYRVRPGSSSRVSTWRRDRHAYVRAKFNAVRRLGYRTLRDQIYLSLSPISLLISPSLALTAVSSLGWYTDASKSVNLSDVNKLIAMEASGE